MRSLTECQDGHVRLTSTMRACACGLRLEATSTMSGLAHDFISRTELWARGTFNAREFPC